MATPKTQAPKLDHDDLCGMLETEADGLMQTGHYLPAGSLLQAARVIRQLDERIDRFRFGPVASDAEPDEVDVDIDEAPVAEPAKKCRHDFRGKNGEAADVCIKPGCGAKKRPNGRPRKQTLIPGTPPPPPPARTRLIKADAGECPETNDGAHRPADDPSVLSCARCKKLVYAYAEVG